MGITQVTLARSWDGEIPVACDHLQAAAVDADLDAAIVGGRRRARGITERVLVAGLAGHRGVGALDGVAFELRETLTASGRGIFRKDVARATERNIDPLCTPV